MEHKCHRYSLDLILGTCVVKPDYHREGLGISHSVTHRRSFETAHVHRIRRARKKKGRTKQRGGDGTDGEQEVVRERRTDRDVKTESRR